MAIRGCGPTLPTSKIKTVVTLPIGDPSAIERLQEVWLRLYGVPPALRHADRLLLTTREVGRPILVDTDSLANLSGPVRMSLGLRAPVKILESVVIFVNMEGSRIELERDDELPGSAAVAPPPPRPPSDKRDDKDDEIEESDEDICDGRRGRHNSREHSPTTAPAGGAVGHARKSVSLAPAGDQSHLPPPDQAQHRAPPEDLNQYGSNISAKGGLSSPLVQSPPPAVASTLPPQLSAFAKNELPVLSVSLPSDTPTAL
jgi:hypothetical protein